MTSAPNQTLRPMPSNPDDELLKELYAKAGIPVDQLPYTDAFDAISDEYCERKGNIANSNETRRHILIRLLNLRKAGMLPRLVQSGSSSSSESSVI